MMEFARGKNTNKTLLANEKFLVFSVSYNVYTLFLFLVRDQFMFLIDILQRCYRITDLYPVYFAIFSGGDELICALLC